MGHKLVSSAMMFSYESFSFCGVYMNCTILLSSMRLNEFLPNLAAIWVYTFIIPFVAVYTLGRLEKWCKIRFCTLCACTELNSNKFLFYSSITRSLKVYFLS